MSRYGADYEAEAIRWIRNAEELYQRTGENGTTDVEAGMLAAAIAQVYATLEAAQATDALRPRRTGGI